MLADLDLDLFAEFGTVEDQAGVLSVGSDVHFVNDSLDEILLPLVVVFHRPRRVQHEQHIRALCTEIYCEKMCFFHYYWNLLNFHGNFASLPMQRGLDKKLCNLIRTYPYKITAYKRFSIWGKFLHWTNGFSNCQVFILCDLFECFHDDFF